MRRFALVTLLVIFSTAVRATVILPIEFRDLVTTTPVIVHAHVTDVRSAFMDGRRTVQTFVTVAADEYLKGNLGEHVTFMVPGGEIGRYKTVFVGAPEFRTGDEVVLFLNTAHGGVPFIVGLSQGAYRVVADNASGRRMVSMPILIGRDSGTPQRIVRGDPARRTLPIEAFRDAVRLVLAEAARK
jgi:hypothetical protein